MSTIIPKNIYYEGLNKNIIVYKTGKNNILPIKRMYYILLTGSFLICSCKKEEANRIYSDL